MFNRHRGDVVINDSGTTTFSGADNANAPLNAPLNAPVNGSINHVLVISVSNVVSQR